MQRDELILGETQSLGAHKAVVRAIVPVRAAAAALHGGAEGRATAPLRESQLAPACLVVVACGAAEGGRVARRQQGTKPVNGMASQGGVALSNHAAWAWTIGPVPPVGGSPAPSRLVL